MSGSNKLSFIIPVVIALACALVPVARADEPAAATGVTWGNDWFAVLPGYAVPSKGYPSTGSGFTLSGIYGHEFAPHWGAELNVQGSVFETGANRGTDYYQSGGTLDLVYQLFDRRQARWTPFILAGVGGVYDDLWPRTRAGGAFLADVGVGVVTQPLFSTGIRFRFDARYNHDSHEGGYHNARFLAGIEIPLGRVEHRVEIRPEVREVVREVVKEVPVASPPPAAEAVVVGQVIQLHGVTFEFNKSRLTPNARTVLDMVARRFTDQPGLRTEIAGHTDSIGSVRSNLKLSQARAEAVRDYLIGHGVKPDQLVAHGYGKSQPLINPERSDADRELNRRVELRVLAN